jgi:hypothetical protein
MFDLLKSGLLNDEDGKLTDETRYKVLEVFGYGGWERTQNVKKLHVSRAEKENCELAKGSVEVSEVDDHALHEAEHIKYFLSSEFARLVEKKPQLKEALLEHIRQHRSYKTAEKQIKGEL